jgi:hypothetical protein
VFFVSYQDVLPHLTWRLLKSLLITDRSALAQPRLRLNWQKVSSVNSYVRLFKTAPPTHVAQADTTLQLQIAIPLGARFCPAFQWELTPDPNAWTAILQV